MAETPIEAIESNFRAPDTTPDMYQLGGDLDPTYFQFLTGFTKPLSKTPLSPLVLVVLAFLLILIVFSAPEIEKDEETDPDYCPAILDLQPGMLLKMNKKPKICLFFLNERYFESIAPHIPYIKSYDFLQLYS